MIRKGKSWKESEREELRGKRVGAVGGTRSAEPMQNRREKLRGTVAAILGRRAGEQALRWGRSMGALRSAVTQSAL